ncbi:MAG: septal ring lytic transglycosylase RlpA family protein [Actinobacteria bacterium]|nr:septal ring lytic transglycosylase RlpA family protein [Actinomycetota bacterium]
MTRVFAAFAVIGLVVLSAGYAAGPSDVPPRRTVRFPVPVPTPVGEARPAPSLPRPTVRTVPATPPCLASYYGEEHRGLAMANGEPFDSDALTAAHPDLPLGSEVVATVAVGSAQRSVTVTITDRGPAAWTGRCLDLSAAAFEQLAPLGVGVLLVTVEVNP